MSRTVRARRASTAGLRQPHLSARNLFFESLEPRRVLTLLAPFVNVDGQGFSGVAPPDTVGAVGRDHFVQMINGAGGSLFTVHDKTTGAVVSGPTALSTLSSGGNCATAAAGDPIVLYDELADRWLLTEFVSPGTANTLCVYVSQTSDPTTGQWFDYSFDTPNFPDYPKYGVWPDAYYISTNEGPGPAVYAIDRNAMIQGLPAAPIQRFSPPGLGGFGFQALTPATVDGATAPPTGAPNYFMRHVDDEVHGGTADPAADRLEIWEFRVDFTTPANSSFTQAASVPIAEIDSDLCGLVSFSCFGQPSSAVQLDPLREVVMWRLQYLNFGTHETMVGNLVTDVDGTDHGGVRWFELRKDPSASSWSLFQEGTISPDASDRWMGSAAMDQAGNIAVGYNLVSSTIFPSLRYTGRLATDPLGSMPAGEMNIVDGTGSHFSNRWGDYSALTVDPADGCTFWFTGEYSLSGGNWATRIASFAFDECLNPPQPPPPEPEDGSISGIKFEDVNGNGVQDMGEPGLAGVAIYVDINGDDLLGFGEAADITDSQGRYSIVVADGQYTVREIVPAGFVQTFPTSGEHLVVVVDGEDVTGIDFGNTSNVDYGDAPAPYPTLASEGGASHGIFAPLFLGQFLDAEIDGLPDDDAEGDDNSNLSDEDGIEFLTPIFAGLPATVRVTVETGGFSPAVLQGFIDFNNDGDWNDAGEQIFKNRKLGTGVHDLTFTVPSNVVVGNSFARFRYSYQRDLGPTGHTPTGEVEDYAVLVLANVPVANDDQFLIPQDTVANRLDVLTNDFPSSAGPLRITGVTQPNRGGSLSVAPNGQFLLYSPAPGFFSPPPETFNYTVSDGAGGFDSATVTINVTPTFVDPIAVDDTFFVSAGSQDNPLDVLANDLPGTAGPIVLVSVTQPATGSVSIDNMNTPNPSDDVLRYTPDANFDKVDQFTYTVSNTLGVLRTATVTIQETPAPATDEMLFILETTDLAGNPITSVGIGQRFKLRVSVQDVRLFPLAPGVAAAYLDVLYDRNLVSVVRDASNPLNFDIEFSDEYDQVISGDALVPGILDEVGAFQSGSAPTGIDAIEVFSVTMIANAEGQADFLGDPADVSPAHDVLFFEPPDVVPIEDIGYGFTSLQIQSGTLDVNLDGLLSPVDALQVINQLNSFGASRGRSGGEGEASFSRFDVNRDGHIAPLDALIVINELNRRAAQPAGQGSPASLDNGLSKTGLYRVSYGQIRRLSPSALLARQFGGEGEAAAPIVPLLTTPTVDRSAAVTSTTPSQADVQAPAQFLTGDADADDELVRDEARTDAAASDSTDDLEALLDDLAADIHAGWQE